MNEKELINDLGELDLDNGGAGGDCVIIRCPKCGAEFGESQEDDHECEPEQEEEIDEDKETKEENDPYGCETIWCEPTCPTCGADKGKCDYTCKDKNNPNYWEPEDDEDKD